MCGCISRGDTDLAQTNAVLSRTRCLLITINLFDLFHTQQSQEAPYMHACILCVLILRPALSSSLRTCQVATYDDIFGRCTQVMANQPVYKTATPPRAAISHGCNKCVCVHVSVRGCGWRDV